MNLIILYLDVKQIVIKKYIYHIQYTIHASLALINYGPFALINLFFNEQENRNDDQNDLPESFYQQMLIFFCSGV